MCKWPDLLLLGGGSGGGVAWTPCETPPVRGGGNAEAEEEDVLDEKVVDEEEVEALEPDELRPDPPVFGNHIIFCALPNIISILDIID